MKLDGLSLRAKLLLTTVITVLLAFSVTLGVLALRSHEAVLEQGMARAEQVTATTVRDIEARLALAMNTANTLARTLEGLHDNGMRDRFVVNETLRQVLAGEPDLLGVYTGWEPDAFDGKDSYYAGAPGQEASGRFVPYWNRVGNHLALETLTGFDVPGEGDYYQYPKRTGQAFVAEPYEYKVSGQTMLVTSLVQPVKVKGAFVGIAGVDLALARFAEDMAKIKPFGVGHVELYTAAGLVVAHPDAASIGKTANDLPPEAIAALKEGRSLQWRDSEGVLHFMQRIPLAHTDTHWGGVIAVPGSEITRSADDMRNTAIVLGLVSVLLTAVVIFLVMTVQTRPLGHLAEAMEALAGGEGDLTRRLPEDRKDELGRVSRAVNQFLGNLQRMFIEVRDQSSGVAQGVLEVSGSADQVAESSGRLADAAGDNAATVEEITVSIAHIASNASEVDTIMGDTQQASHQSCARVRDMQSHMSSIADSIRMLSESLSGLADRSSEISGIVNVIREIADQTNLLALNAAIEAARAGEQGRGFAVVADEVRKLAERTSTATSEIHRMIDGMQGETVRAVGNMNETRAAVESGVERASSVAEEIAEIEQSISRAAARVREIAEATNEQSSATTLLAQSAEQTSNAVQTVDGAIQQASATLRELGVMADRLGALVARFKL